MMSKTKQQDKISEKHVKQKIRHNNMSSDFMENLAIAHNKILELKNEHRDFFGNIKLNLKINKDNPSKISAKLPNNQTIKAFLVDLRPFLLQKEYLYFPSMCNDIIKNIRDNKLIGDTEKAKKAWNKFCNGYSVGGIVMKINKKKITVRENIDLWLNGKFMHPTDKKKAKHKKLREIDKPPFGLMDYFLFVDILRRLAISIFWLDENVIIKILER